MSRVYFDLIFRGDLSRIIKKDGQIPESMAKLYLAEVLLAIEDLHKRNIIFRDLKPENILLDEEGHAILTDFGLSKEDIDDESITKTFCGSAAYLAPEMISKNGYNKYLDWYLYGLMTYEMLIGEPPYYNSNRKTYYENVKNAELKLPSYLTKDAKDFIMKLLNRVPSQRLGAGVNGTENIKNHPWFKEIDWKIVINRRLKPPKPMSPTVAIDKIDEEVFNEGKKYYVRLLNWSFENDNEENTNNMDPNEEYKLTNT